MASYIFRDFLLSRVGAEANILTLERAMGLNTDGWLLQQARHKNYL